MSSARRLSDRFARRRHRRRRRQAWAQGARRRRRRGRRAPQVVALRVLWTALDIDVRRCSATSVQNSPTAWCPPSRPSPGRPLTQSVSLLALTCYLQLTWHLHDGKDAAADDEALSEASPRRAAISDAMGWAAAASPAAAMGGAVNLQALALSESARTSRSHRARRARGRGRGRGVAVGRRWRRLTDGGEDGDGRHRDGRRSARQPARGWRRRAAPASSRRAAGAATKFVGETLTLCGAAATARRRCARAPARVELRSTSSTSAPPTAVSSRSASSRPRSAPPPTPTTSRRV